MKTNQTLSLSLSLSRILQCTCGSIFLLANLLIGNGHLSAQPWVRMMGDSTQNYYTIMDSAVAWRMIDSTDTSESGSYNNYLRWEWYWRNRVDSAGSMGAAIRNQQQSYNLLFQAPPTPVSKPSAANSVNYDVKWRQLGPFVPPMEVTATMPPTNHHRHTGIGRVNCVKFHPTNYNTIYAGTHGGLFVTTNLGQKWEVCNTDKELWGSSITTIAIHPNDPDYIYIGTGSFPVRSAEYSAGVFISTDAGTTWNHFGSNFPNGNTVQYDGIRDIKIHPDDDNLIYALTNSGIIFRSTDKGITWSHFNNVNTYKNNAFNYGNGYHGNKPDFYHIDFFDDGTNPIIMFVSGKRVFRSTDDGSSFTDITSDIEPHYYDPASSADITGMFMSRIQEIDNDTLIAFYVKELNPNDFRGRMKYSTDWGVTWYSMTTLGYVNDESTSATTHDVNTYHFPFYVSPLDRKNAYLLGNNDYPFMRSGNRGKDFFGSDVALAAFSIANDNKMHADGRGLDIFPTLVNGEELLVIANDGDISLSTNGGVSWTPICVTDGPACGLIYHVDVHNEDEEVFVTGWLDSGTMVYDHGVWYTVQGGDGGACLITPPAPTNPTVPFYVYGINGMVRNTLNKSHDGGLNFTHSRTGEQGVTGLSMGFDFGLIGHPTDPAYLYKADQNGTRGFVYSSDYGTTWNSIHTLDVMNDIAYTPRVIKMAPSDPNVMYLVYWYHYNWTPDASPQQRIYVSTNGISGPFNDITQGSSSSTGLKDPLEWSNITDVAVDPDDAGKIWISFQGIGNKKLYLSTDYGSTWSDQTGDLFAGNPMLNFPVNCITPMKGAHDPLVIGTDVGIFYTDNTLASSSGRQWLSFNGDQFNANYLPPEHVTSMEASKDGKNLIVSVFGRGIWKADMDCFFDQSSNAEITSNTTWNDDVRMDRTLVIKNGATLTVKGTVYFPEKAKLIIERGAKLIVDGGELTSCADHYLWEGVELWGNRSVAQTDLSTSGQGKLEMINGAIISDARNGVTLIKWDIDPLTGIRTPDWNYTGGIIQATNSKFLNNARAVEFMSYRWANSTIPVNNFSYFVNCDFRYTRKLNDKNQDPFAFITMYDVMNVGLWGNMFDNEIYPFERAGMGIYCELANLRLRNSTTYGNNEFKNLMVGIRTMDNTMTYVTKVEDTQFINNNGGIHLIHALYPIASKNYFEIKTPEIADICGTVDYVDAYGLFLDHATGFQADRSEYLSYGSFMPPSGNFLEDQDKKIGIIAKNVGKSANFIDNNRFSNLFIGIKSEGVNAITSFMHARTGLMFRCNIFEDEIYKSDIGVVANGRIGYTQGWTNSTNPTNQTQAGNEFNNTTTAGVNSFNHIAYFELDHVIYEHHVESECIPTLFLNGPVQLNQAMYSINNPISKVGGCTPWAELQLDTIYSEIANKLSEFRDTVWVLEDSLAMGDMDTLISIAAVATPADVLTELQPYFPLLSDRVLEQVALRAWEDTLAPEFVEILLVHSPLSSSIWDMVLELDLDSLQAAQLNEAQEGLSGRNRFLARTTHLAMQRDDLCDFHIRKWLHDEEDTLRFNKSAGLLRICPRLESKFNLADIYIQQGDDTALDALLDSIQTAHPEWETYCQLQQAIAPYYHQPGGVKAAIEDMDVLGLIESINIDDKPGKARANVLLEIIKSKMHCSTSGVLSAPPGLPAERKAEARSVPEQLSIEGLRIYPNPATAELNVIGNFNSTPVYWLEIKDMLGRQVMAMPNVPVNKVQSFDVSLLPSGVYVLSIQSKGRVFSEKLVRP